MASFSEIKKQQSKEGLSLAEITKGATPPVKTPASEESILSKATDFAGGLIKDVVNFGIDKIAETPVFKKAGEDIEAGVAERKQKEVELNTELSRAYSVNDEKALEEASKKLHELKGERSAGEIISEIPQDVSLGIKTFSEASKLIPENIKSAYLQATKGGEEASVVDKDTASEYIRSVEKKNNALIEEVKNNQGDKKIFGLPIRFSDIAQLPQSVGYSGVSMGAGLAAGVPTALIPYVGTVAAWGVGTTASGKVAYEMSTYQITQQFLEAKNEEKISTTGVGLTKQEENQLKDEFQYLAMQYGLWEAVPEAISNAAFLKILTIPLSKMIGGNLAGRVAEKVAAVYGEELLTETITQMGQTNVEIKAGLSKEKPRDWKSPEDWSTSFKEVAPQTFLLTTLMAGAGQSVISTKSAYDKIRASFTEELKKKGVPEETINELAKSIPNPKGDEKKKEIAQQVADGKSPTQIALELSQEMGATEARTLVDEVVAKSAETSTETVVKEEPKVSPKATALEDTTKAMEGIIDKTPQKIQEDFTALADKQEADKQEILSKIDELKNTIKSAKEGSVEKKLAKKELSKQQDKLNKAEATFEEAFTNQASDFRTFLGEYITKTFKMDITPAQNEYLINKIVERSTTPDTPHFKRPLKDIVASTVSAMQKAVQVRAEQEKTSPKKAKSEPKKKTPVQKVSEMSEEELTTERIRLVNKNLGEKLSKEENSRLDAIIEKLKGKTQKEKVKEVVAKKGKASIKEIAKETGILEPNIRRILGVGAKEGEFERIADGVYRVTIGDQEMAVIIPADAREALPELVKNGFKADMVFLDIPYDTPAVKGGNRGAKYDFISVADFSKILDAVVDIAKTENSPVVHMFSQAKSGLKEMQKYNDLFVEKGFKPVGRGEYQKTYKDGKPVAFPTIHGSKVTEPEGILVFTKSGELDKDLENLNFKLVRPKGYQTEKPAEMLKALIEMTTNEGDIILDPFAGSGVTGSEAVKSKRKAVLIEKNKEQAKKIKERVEEGVDKGKKVEDTKGNGKDTNNRRGDDNGGEVSTPISDSTDKSDGTGGAVEVPTDTKRREGGSAKRSEKLGKRLGARLTNKEIEEIVNSITTLDASGEVILSGEVTEDILESANQYQAGGETKEGRGVLDEYYTNSKIVDMVKSLFDFPAKPLKVLEPAVGTGNFIYALPEIGTHDIVSYEINETTAKIAKIFHQNAKVFNKSFETNFIDERGNALPFKNDYDLVIGNPPYGEHRGVYLGLGEEKGITKYEDYFVKRGLDVLKKGGKLAMVVPSSFLRSGENSTKLTISAIGVLDVAFRLPNGVFEGTDIGTDIIVMHRRDPKSELTDLNSLVGDNFFKENPANVLGTTKKRKNRFGQMDDVVEGTLDEAINLFYENNNAREAIQLLKELNVEATQENIEDAEKAIDEAGDKAKGLVKEAQKKGKETIEKKIVKQAVKKDQIVSLSAQFEGEFTEEELASWKDTQADGSLKNHEKHADANYMGGKWYNDFNYAQGDIYEKLKQLEYDFPAMQFGKGTQQERTQFEKDQAQYAIQKAKLEAVKPKQESIENLKLSPNIGFVKDLKMEEEKTLQTLFLAWIRELPREAFGGSSSYEVRAYVYDEQVRGSDKDRNELERGRRKIAADNLFAKFLKEGLSDEQKAVVEEKYNETFNFYHTPDYKKVPMFSNVFSTFAGDEFSLRDVQKHGIGRLVNTGVGILAHDVGFGKTISGVLAISETMHRGWANKPIIVVPSENVYRQWIKTIEELIPEAKLNLLGNLGVGFKGDLSTLAIPDKSITLVTYEGLKRLGFKDETYASLSAKFGYISDDLTKHKTERDQEKAKAGFQRTGGVMKKGTRADLSFEDLGFDHITFDEVHNANHIVGKVKLEKGKASEFNRFTLRPSDLGIKTWLASQYIQQKMNGRNVNLLSATPFTNHPLEYYSILSLVADKSLLKMGLGNVNDFFGTFMEAENEYEFKADGTYQKKTDIRRFRNFRQFRKLLDTYIDFKEGDAEGIIRPTRVQKTYEIPQNQFGLDMETKAQAIFKETEKEAGKGAKVLRAITELRKIAFSPYASKFAEDIKSTQYKEFVENSPKIKVLMNLIARNKKDREEAGQIIYVDQVGVEFLPVMREYLIKEVGYKASEVEIISGATAKTKRTDIQNDYNTGKIKVLLGSEAIKEGMNLQENTSDLYILSLPWNFTQLRQVIGRAWRQGNRWTNVRINNLFIQDSVDIFLSQKLENKQKRYEAAIKSGDQEVDVGDVSFDEMKFDLIRDPQTRAKLELQAEKERLSQEISQQKAETAFATRKLEKINDIANNIDRAKDNLKFEEKEYAEKQAMGKEVDTYWIEKYTNDIAKFEKEQAEELAKLKEKGIDTEVLLKKRTEGEAKIAELENKEKELTDTFEERVQAISTSMTPRVLFSPAVVEGMVADRAEQNKDFYKLKEEDSEEVVTVEVKKKEIKNASGTKVIKTKTKTEVKRAPVAKKGTKDNAMLKILTDAKLTVQEKVDTLLDKKQEGKKFKDAGERVAGSKKENAIIQAVIEHGNDDILRTLAQELGNDVILAQLSKQKILENEEVPTAELEISKNTPAFVANYKVNVFNRMGRTPQIVEDRGKWDKRTLVDKGDVADFIVKYPSALKQFNKDLNAISTAEEALKFEEKYEYNLFSLGEIDGREKTVRISVLGKNFRTVLDADNVSSYSGAFKKSGYSSAFKDYEEAQETLKAIENDGVIVSYDTYHEKNKYRAMGFQINENSIWRGGSQQDTLEEAKLDFETKIREEKLDKKEVFTSEKTKAEATIKDLIENYDKYLPKVEMGKAKQIADAETKVESLKKNLQRYEEEVEKDPESFYKQYIPRTIQEIADQEAFIARLKGADETALTHGNFQAIEEYDVKDTRFKKDFVKTENLMRVYGFKSAQLGNYMDDLSAKEHIIQTMASMEDMSKILGIDFATIANKMGLSIAFGARGGGGSAVAHFEPTHKIINITKKRGDGSFGHEFMHALDFILGAPTYRHKWSGGNGYGRYTYTVGDRESMLLTRAFLRGVEIDTEKTFNPKDVEQDGINEIVIKWRKEGKTLEEAVERVPVVFSQPQHERIYQDVANLYRENVTAKVKNTSNEYYQNSLKYGGGKDTSYWVRKEELWARAFQAYLEDKLESAGIKNNYLTRSTKNIGVYPQGAERVEINKLFDNLFESIKAEYPLKEGQEVRFKKDGEVKTTYGMTEAGAYLNGVKARLNIDFDVNFVDNILAGYSVNPFTKQKRDVEAYGATVDNTITLVKDMASYTAEHETVHLTLANLEKIPVFKNQGITREKVLSAQAEIMGVQHTKANEFRIEEELALNFEKFISEKYEPKGIIRKFFVLLKQAIFRLARAIGIEPNIIDNYYDILAEGEAVDGEMVRLENKGIVEAYIEDGVLNVDKLEAQFKLKDEGDVRLRKLKESFNELSEKTSELEKNTIEWKNNMDAELAKQAEIAPVVAETTDKVKELARFTNRKKPPVGTLTKTGEEMAEKLDFVSVEEAQEEIGAYLKRKSQLVETRNRLRDLRRQISSAKKENKISKAVLRDVERKLKLRQKLLETKDYYVEIGFGRGEKAKMKMIRRRGLVLREMQELIGLSDARAQKLIGGIGRQRIHLMSESGFNNFMVEFVNRGRDIVSAIDARDSVRAYIAEMQFQNEDNVRKAMKFPPIDKMTQQQAEAFEGILSQYESGDIFLTKRQLETIHRTNWGDVRTQREMHEKIAKDTGITREDMKNLKIDRTWQKFKNWLVLSRSNPVFAWLVERRFKAKLQSELEVVAFENELNPLVRRARASRVKTAGEKVAQAFAPMDEIVFDYIESENKVQFIKDKKMTKEELDLANFLIGRLFEPAREYMQAEYGMKDRENYITHIRRDIVETFVSALKEGRSIKSGFVEALREVFTSQREDEAMFKILGGKTGEVLAFEKWFKFSMPRTGNLVPTKNVAKASLAYASAYFNKKALDELIPEAVALAKVQEDVQGYTPKGLPKDPTVKTFIDQFLNDAKGRKIDFVTTQGDSLDNALRLGVAWTAFKYLGFRPVLGMVNFIGEFVGTFMATTSQEKINGLKRTLELKKSHEVNKEYEYFTGRNPLVELFDPQHGIVTKVKDAALVLFSLASFFNNRFYLRAKMSEQEWQNELVEDKRMIEITKEMSKWRKTPFYIPSLAGGTATGSMFNQFATWAIPIVTTSISNINEILKTKNKEGWKTGLSSTEAKEVYKTVAVMGTLYFFAIAIKSMEGDDDDERDIWFYATRELNSLLGAFSVVFNLEGRAPLLRELLNFQTLVIQLFNMERYKKDGVGYSIGDLKAKKTAIGLIVPSFAKNLFLDKERQNTKEKMIQDAIESGVLDAEKIAETINPEDWNNTIKEPRNEKDQKEYRAKKVGEIKALYHLREKYPDSKIGQIIIDEQKNDVRVKKMVEYAKEVGVDKATSEIKDLYRDRNLCANTKNKTNCLVSGKLYKEYIKAKNKI